MNKVTGIPTMFLILLVVPFVFGFSANTSSYSVDSYHTGISGNTPNTSSYNSRSTTVYQQGGSANGTTSSYSFNAGWFEVESLITEEEEDTSTPVSDGGGGGTAVECYDDSGCLENQYCFQNSCFDAECTDDSVCNVGEGEVCWNLRCVKLFDIKIIDFESPITLGEFFDFTYFVKGVADINGDVIINFRIEKDGNVVSSGYDVVYFGSFEEKTETTSLFLPSDTKSGTYEFIIEVNLGTYVAQSSRTVEISVEGGVATLRLFDISFSLENAVIESSDELFGIVTFENFGNVPTSVYLTFIILNEDGNEVHRGEESITVETEEILRKSFKGLDLPTGKYTVVLETLYNTDVSDEFRQEFEIVSGFGQYLYYGWIGISILLIVLLIVLITWFVLRRKPGIKIQVARRVSDRIRQMKVASEARRNKRELRKLQRMKEKEAARRQKLRNKAEKQKIINLRRREKNKIAEEKLVEKSKDKSERESVRDLRQKREKQELAKERLVEKSKRKAENKRTIMERILGRKEVLRAKEEMLNEKVAWRIGLERKKISEEKRLSNSKVKEVVRGHKKLEKLKQDKMKVVEVAKKIKSLEKKKVLLQKGYQAGYINKKAYKLDMKKINKLISGLRK